jgi:hypothetical protein
MEALGTVADVLADRRGRGVADVRELVVKVASDRGRLSAR